jgi:hypothetical protein
MFKLERMREGKKDPIEFIFINPEQVTVIVPRSDTIHGPACDVSLSNATTWAVQHEAENLAKTIATGRELGVWPKW